MEVLLIDDDPSVLEQAKIFLEKEDENLKIITAPSAKKGLKLLQEKEFDVVVSDYGMPKTDGIEFLRKVREEENLEIPFIMLTGKGKEEIAMKALNLGADKYLQKIKRPKEQYSILANSIIEVKQQKEREEELRRYKTIIEEANDDILIIDLEGNIKFVNKKSQKFLGFENEELLGKNIFDFTHPDEKEKISERFEEFLNSDSREMEEKIESRWRRSDGSYYWFESKGKVIDNGENILIISRNIEERKKRERELKRKKWYLDNIPIFVQVLDEDMNIIYRNENPLQDDSLSKDEIKDSNLIEFVHPDDQGKVIEIFNESLKNPEEVYKDTFRGKTKEGWKWFEGSIINFLEKPEIEGLIVTGQDITERKEVEEREDFLHSMLRHDIRNKTQVIQSYQSMLKDYDLPEEALEYLENANRAAKNNMKLIEKIRALKDIKEEDEIKNVNIGQVIKNRIRSNIVDDLRKDIDIEIEDIDFEVRAGPLIGQVFLNLVENSVKHCNCERIKISGKEADGKIIVSVEDDGIGVPEDEKEKIFERGYKSGETGGTGLGLFLSKEITESYGGKIEVEDSKHGGARFNVHLKKK